MRLAGVGGVDLLHADELDGHGLKARLVQHIGVDARLQGVLLLQLFRRLVRRPARLVVDDQRARRIGRSVAKASMAPSAYAP